jgi:hypothetical protein
LLILASPIEYMSCLSSGNDAGESQGVAQCCITDPHCEWIRKRQPAQTAVEIRKYLRKCSFDCAIKDAFEKVHIVLLQNSHECRVAVSIDADPDLPEHRDLTQPVWFDERDHWHQTDPDPDPGPSPSLLPAPDPGADAEPEVEVGVKADDAGVGALAGSGGGHKVEAAVATSDHAVECGGVGDGVLDKECLWEAVPIEFVEGCSTAAPTDHVEDSDGA